MKKTSSLSSTLTAPLLGLLFAALAHTNGGALPPLLFAVLSHEAGHLFALSLCRIPLSAVCISLGGIRIRSDLSTLSYPKEAAVAGAGPLVNLISAAIFLSLGMTNAAAPSLLLGIYNLLPLSTFDGGRLLTCLLCAATPLPPRAVHITCQAVSMFTLALLYLFCSWFFCAVALFGENAPSLTSGAWFFSVWGILCEQLHAAKWQK